MDKPADDDVEQQREFSSCRAAAQPPRTLPGRTDGLVRVAAARDRRRGLGAVPRFDGGDPRGVRDGSRHARHERDPGAVPAGTLRVDRRVRRRPQACDDLPGGDRRGLVSAGQIIEGPIEFHCLCEHHALPFFGTAYLGYVADERIIGISKLTRLVRLYARRFTVQERLGEQIADGLVSLVAPRGVAVHLEAAHLCTQMRGVEEHSRTVTTFWRGAFDDPELRREFLSRFAPPSTRTMSETSLVCGASGALGGAIVDALLARGDRGRVP